MTKLWAAQADKLKAAHIPALGGVMDSDREELRKQFISEEAEGIIAWAVKGAREWVKRGLPFPPPATGDEDVCFLQSIIDEVFGDQAWKIPPVMALYAADLMKKHGDGDLLRAYREVVLTRKVMKGARWEGFGLN